MGTDVVVSVEDVWKQYRLGAIGYTTLQQDVQRWWAKLKGREDPNSCVQPVSSAVASGLFWAVQAVSLEVRRGELLGIIGRNGAGKSTLLKILSRVTTPTRGRIRIKGRVASLLEVGTGFHPDLTGRENVFLNGAILGMSRAELFRKFDEIVAFAEIEKFIDTPVKRYSSGMYVRLAFAVAAHLEPEILVVDEVLAVGDAAFQKKCLGKMQEVGSQGRTVLFVSHNMGAIHSLTDRCVYLDSGRVRSCGETADVVAEYLADAAGGSNAGGHDLDYYRPDYVIKAHAETCKVRISSLCIEQGGEKRTTLDMGESFTVLLELEVVEAVAGANLSLSIANAEFQSVVVILSWDAGFYLDLAPGRHFIRAEMRGHVLPPGRYYVGAGVNQSTETVAWDVVANLPLFEVRNTGKVVHWLHRQWGGEHWDNVRWVQESS